MWLHPLTPKQDELLSSWLLRICRYHHLKPHTFCDIVWPRLSIWNRDIDLSASNEILEVLASNTLANLSSSKSTSLLSYQGILTDYISIKTKNKWLTSLGVLHRTHKRFGQMYCPNCLAEDGYYKKLWRVTISTECTKHKVPLLDCCQTCLSPVVPKRVDFKSPISDCFNCGSSLGRQNQKTSQSSDLRRQRYFEIAIKHGWIRNKNGPVYSLGYFRFIEKLIWLLCRKQSRQSLYNRKQLAIFPNNSWDLAFLRVNARRILLSKVWELLENYPHAVITFVKNEGIAWSKIQADYNNWPYFTETDLHAPLTHSLSASDRAKCQA